MASSTISLIQGIDKDVDMVAVQDDGAPIDLTDAAILQVVRNADNEIVLQRSSVDTTQIVVLDGPGGRYRLHYRASDTTALALASYLHDVKATLADGTSVSLVDPSFFVVSLGGVTTTPTPAFSNNVPLDHNFDLPDNLRYMDAGGNPINDAQVRVYLRSDYDAKRLDSPVGVTLTRADGRWVNPVLVVPGFDYVVRFEAPFRFGPDIATITV